MSSSLTYPDLDIADYMPFLTSATFYNLENQTLPLSPRFSENEESKPGDTMTAPHHTNNSTSCASSGGQVDLAQYDSLPCVGYMADIFGELDDNINSLSSVGNVTANVHQGEVHQRYSTAGRHRVPHKQVERKYRHGLNSKFTELQDMLAEQIAKENAADIEDLGKVGRKMGKAEVLAGAVDYVRTSKHLQQEHERTIARLQAHIKALRDLINCNNCSFYKFAMAMKHTGAKTTQNLGRPES